MPNAAANVHPDVGVRFAHPNLFMLKSLFIINMLLLFLESAFNTVALPPGRPTGKRQVREAKIRYSHSAIN
jgi:hypothetical protein